MRLGVLFSVVLLGASLACAVDISVSSDPPLPVPNLLQNPNLDLGKDGRPEGWRFSTARPDIFETGWVDDPHSGKCLWLKAATAEMSGYWAQTVAVQPGVTYRFKGQFRLGAGRILCYVHGRTTLADGRDVAVDTRIYRGTKRGHWLVPVFLPADSLGGPAPETWVPFSLRVPVPDSLPEVTFSLGMYFTAGEAWFDSVWGGVAETTLAVAVRAGERESLRQVKVCQEGVDKPIRDSGPLAADTTTFAVQLADMPADARYRILVVTHEGMETDAYYPAMETGGERR